MVILDRRLSLWPGLRCERRESGFVDGWHGRRSQIADYHCGTGGGSGCAAGPGPLILDHRHRDLGRGAGGGSGCTAGR